METAYGGASHEKAGEIATQVLKEMAGKVKPGASILELVEWGEGEIIMKGGGLGFPCSIAINDFAAHCSPLAGNSSVIPDGSLVKVDLGVHMDGYVADCATTVNLDSAFTNLERASIEGLKAGIESIRAGVKICEVSAQICSQIEAHDAKPIYNLSGHSIGRHMVHTGISIPNHSCSDDYVFKEGDVFAVEPFATNGGGYVKDGGLAGIYRLIGQKNYRNITARKISSKIFGERKTLPFAERWLHKIEPSRFALSGALREMLSSGSVEEYPPLRESTGGMVSQHECTVLVESGGCHIISGELK